MAPVSTNPAVEEELVPPGNYQLVSWDLDTTGRRLIDEICHIAAYHPTSSFSQYVMPYRDLNPVARRRHNLRVVNIGRYRMLKDLQSGLILKTKSEVSALTALMKWLGEVRGDTDGVLLVNHEPRKSATPMLLEALSRYNLLDDFLKVVKGFTNSHKIAAAKYSKSSRALSLKVLSQTLLEENDVVLMSAVHRAKIVYEIVNRLMSEDTLPPLPGRRSRQNSRRRRNSSTASKDTDQEKDVKTNSDKPLPKREARPKENKTPKEVKVEDDKTTSKERKEEENVESKVIEIKETKEIKDTKDTKEIKEIKETIEIKKEPIDEEENKENLKPKPVSELATAVSVFCHAPAVEQTELAALKNILEKQNALRPIFAGQLRLGRKERQRATQLRRLLVEAGLDYLSLQQTFVGQGKAGLEASINASIVLTSQDKVVEELLELLLDHFEKETKPSSGKKSGGSGDGLNGTA